MLYDGNVIAKETNVISIANSEENLMLEEESKSKMLLKQSDPMVLKQKVNIKPINYAELNRLSEDFGKLFSHNKNCLMNKFYTLILTNLLLQLSKLRLLGKFLRQTMLEIQKKQFLIENDRLLDQIISQDIVNIVVNSSLDVNTSVKENSSVDTNDSVNYVEMKKVFLITALKNDLRKAKGKDIVDNVAQVSNTTTISPGMHKLEPVILAPKVKNNREAHEYYLKHTRNKLLFLGSYVRDTCPNIHKPSEKLVAVTPINKKKMFRFADTVTSSGNIPKVPNRPILSSTGVNPSTSASGSKPSGNTKNDRILRTPSSNEKNKVEVQSRKVKSSLNKRNSDSKNRAKSVSKKNKKRKEWKPIGKVFNSIGYKWKPTGRTFTLDGNACPLTRLTATKKVPLRVPIPLEVVAPKHVVTRVYTRRPKVPKSIQNSKPKVAKSMTANRMEHGTSWGSDTSVAPSSFSLIDRSTVKFGNDQVTKIMGYGDYQIQNITISRVYYVKGLGHNLFSVGQFCDSDLKVAFRKYTCFIRNLEGVDLLSGSRGTNLYSLSIGNMMTSSPICLLSKATKTNSWLWHRRLSHLNFGAINHLARHGLVCGLPRLKFEKDHLCSACVMGKRKKQSHKPKS
ncbi:retrovirus-related pol polyprotein from transposon TNT 1-94 [Tanacetum coccineum]